MVTIPRVCRRFNIKTAGMTLRAQLSRVKDELLPSKSSPVIVFPVAVGKGKRREKLKQRMQQERREEVGGC